MKPICASTPKTQDVSSSSSLPEEVDESVNVKKEVEPVTAAVTPVIVTTDTELSAQQQKTVGKNVVPGSSSVAKYLFNSLLVVLIFLAVAVALFEVSFFLFSHNTYIDHTK